MVIAYRKIAIIQIQKLHAYISRDSLKNADKVKVEILRTLDSLIQHPENIQKTNITTANQTP